MCSSTVSSPMGVIEIVVPTSNGQEISIRSTSSFQSDQDATSDQRRQMASGDVAVPMLCSVAHISLRRSSQSGSG